MTRSVSRGCAWGVMLLIVCLTAANASAGAPKKDIVDTAVSAGAFKTLVTAVKLSLIHI